jgi:hypothetical protein
VKCTVLYAVMLLCLAGVFMIPLPAMADSSRCDKTVVIHANVNQGRFSVISSEILYSSAPHLFPNQGNFTGTMIAGNGEIIKTFPVWDPRYQFGDEIVNNSNGTQIRLLEYYQDNVDFVAVVPFDPNLTAFQLDDPATNSTLLRVDLRPTITTFFMQYPEDPDNPSEHAVCSARMVPLRMDNKLPVSRTGLSYESVFLPAIGAGIFLLVIAILRLRRCR